MRGIYYVYIYIIYPAISGEIINTNSLFIFLLFDSDFHLYFLYFL